MTEGDFDGKGRELMRARLFIGVVAVVAFTAVAGTGFAGAKGAAATKVTIKGPNGDFQGKVKSDRGKCLKRKVTVFKLLGNGYDPSNDREIATDTSERQGDVGVWSVGNTGEKKGDYYAYAHRKTGCKPAASKIITLP